MVLQEDNRAISPLSFDENLKEKYTDPEFDYSDSADRGKNLIEMFFDWLFRQIREVFGVQVSPEMAKIMRYFVYALLAAFAIWLIVKLLTNQSPRSLFTKNQQNFGEVYFDDEEIEKIDFKALIKTALSDNNYRLALRYLYLLTLKDLSSKGVLKWHKDKTNIEYLMEIKHPQIKDEFKQLSYVYDNVWYGEYDIDQTDFRSLENKYNQLQRIL